MAAIQALDRVPRDRVSAGTQGLKVNCLRICPLSLVFTVHCLSGCVVHFSFEVARQIGMAWRRNMSMHEVCRTTEFQSPLRRKTVACLLALLTLLAFAGASRAEDLVAVLITGPLAANVGDRVAFEVEIVNRSGKAIEKLRIVDYFDKGYHHDASASPIEQKGTIDLAAGTSRRLTLDFLLDEPGRQCHRVEILDGAHVFVGGATACVQVAPVPVATALAPAPVATALAPVPVATTLDAAPDLLPPAGFAPAVPASPFPATQAATVPATLSPAPLATASLELDLVGPAEALVETVAEYSATVRNTGSLTSGATSLEISWEESLIPLEASDGYRLGNSRGSVSWSIPGIEPGGQLRRQINLRPQAMGSSPSDSSHQGARSCVRSVLSGLVGGVMVADESCVLVRSNASRPRSPREAGLRLTLADCDDPVRSGHATTIVCTIANDSPAASVSAGGTPSGRLDLMIVLPDEARLVGDPIPSRVRIDGSTIMFDSITNIAPGSQATFELSYRLPTGGVGKARAIVSGSELEGSLESTCATSFVAP